MPDIKKYQKLLGINAEWCHRCCRFGGSSNDDCWSSLVGTCKIFAKSAWA